MLMDGYVCVLVKLYLLKRGGGLYLVNRSKFINFCCNKKI